MNLVSNTSVRTVGAVALAALFSAGVSFAGDIVNGSFEDGTTNGWVTGGGFNFGDTADAATGTVPTLSASSYLGSGTNSVTVVGTGYDPVLGGTLLPTVYSTLGTHSVRVNDSNNN